MPTGLNRSFVMSAIVCAGCASTPPGDWPMYGHDASRNAVVSVQDPPLDWHVSVDDDGEIIATRNIKWHAPLSGGFGGLGSPIVANGLVWVGTNNNPPRDPDRTGDAAVLLCFGESDGKFVWQYVSPRGPRHFDWDFAGMRAAPVIENDRLWLVTNRTEVICFDIGPLQRGQGAPTVLWKLDMIDEFGVFPMNSIMGVGGGNRSIGGPYRGKVYVITGNGLNRARKDVPNPRAPGLLCLDQATGALVWEAQAPAKDILLGAWCTPLVIEVGGHGLVIADMGDGRLRAFDADTGRPRWTFDCNPPDYRVDEKGKPRPHVDRLGPGIVMNAPVYHDGRVYAMIGSELEGSYGRGNLVCLDAATGEPVWQNRKLNRSMCSPVVHEGLVYAADSEGYMHCVDDRTGELHWRYDGLTRITGSPLLLGDNLYVGTDDGYITILDLIKLEELRRQMGGAFEMVLVPESGAIRVESATKTLKLPVGIAPIREIEMPDSVMSSPIYANGVLYLRTGGRLFAIQQAP